jgi:hypothetical protein
MEMAVFTYRPDPFSLFRYCISFMENYAFATQHKVGVCGALALSFRKVNSNSSEQPERNQQS